MAWAPATNITYWSISVWNDWTKCPKMAWFKHVKKFKEPTEFNIAMARGTEVHKDAEMFLKGRVKKLPPTLKYFGDEFAFLKKYGAKPEADKAFRRDWSITRGDDFQSAWCRVKIDAELEYDDNSITAIDFKTGKVADYELQMNLYGVAEFIVYPHVTRVDAEVWFLDQGEKQTYTYHREVDYYKNRESWEYRVGTMLRDRAFKPTPGNQCNWCYYRKSNAKNVTYPKGLVPCVHG